MFFFNNRMPSTDNEFKTQEGSPRRGFALVCSRFVLLFGVCGVAACSPRVSDANLHEVKPDMTTKEVESILGQPTKVEMPPEPDTTEVVKTLHVTRYVYQQNGKKVILRFVGDRLVTNGVEGSFDK